MLLLILGTGLLRQVGLKIMPFSVLWVLAAPVGAMANLGFIWLVADTLNAFMAIPNLIALVLLSPVVFKLTRDYFESNGDSENAANETA